MRFFFFLVLFLSLPTVLLPLCFLCSLSLSFSLRTKVPPDDAVPQRRVPPVKLLLDVRGDVLFDRVLVDCLFCFGGGWWRGRWRFGVESEREREKGGGSVFFKATAPVGRKERQRVHRPCSLHSRAVFFAFRTLSGLQRSRRIPETPHSTSTRRRGEHGDGEKRRHRRLSSPMFFRRDRNARPSRRSYRRRAVDGVLLEVLGHVDGLDGGLALLHFFCGLSARARERGKRGAR